MTLSDRILFGWVCIGSFDGVDLAQPVFVHEPPNLVAVEGDEGAAGLGSVSEFVGPTGIFAVQVAVKHFRNLVI